VKIKTKKWSHLNRSKRNVFVSFKKRSTRKLLRTRIYTKSIFVRLKTKKLKTKN